MQTPQVIASIHGWRRQPCNALQATGEKLKLPSSQAKPTQNDNPLWVAVEEALANDSADKALADTDAALQKAKEAGDKKGQAVAMYLESHVRVVLEDRAAIDKLAATMKEVAALYKQANARQEELDVNKDIMEFLFLNGKNDEAEGMEKEIRAEVKSDKKLEASTLLDLAAVYYVLGRLDKAKGLVDEAAAAFEGLKDKAGLGQASLASAVLSLSQQKFDDALNILERSLQAQDDKKLKASIQYAMSQVHCAMGPQGLGSAFSDLKKARAFMQEARDPEGELEVLQVMQELHASQNQASEAMAINKEALAVTQASGDKKKEAQALLRLVSANLSTQNEIEALRLAEEAESKAKEAGDIACEAEASSNIAEVLLRRGDKAAALKRARDLLALCRQKSYEPGQAAAMVVLGSALLNDNAQSAEGMRCLQDAVRIYKESNDFVGLYSAHFALANAYFVRGDLEDGLTHAREVLSCCRRNGDKVNEEFVKQNIERGRQYAAAMRLTQAKRPSNESAGILLPPSGPQPCNTRFSRIPGSLLNIVAAGRNYWGVPRTIEDPTADDDRPPCHTIIWAHPMSDHSTTQMCLDFMHLVGAMAKNEVSKIPIIVQTRGVQERWCGGMTQGNMTSVMAVALWGLIKTCRTEIPQVPIMVLDFAHGLTTAQIPRQLKPPLGVPETVYFNKSRWEPQLVAVKSLLRADLKRDSMQGGGAGGGSTMDDSKKQGGQKFSRKPFSWVGPSIKMDYCWYTQEWKAVGAAEGEIIAQDPVVPVRALRQY
eukprot:TRINITY_DN2513_c0_g1_i3.p1 TRINITY_DN2513_c0_g1~~TRINITY_DN2513_c0_g1_i3.p1  ORF type:complete len:783 (-),score=193.59 TRINITY_DN2513_c0_g1_i3:266-2578(-)